jgi:ATP-binding cassette subfamily B protein
LSFYAEAGSFTGVVGASGSGKTTISALLPRLYDVTAGSVLIAGIDIRKYTTKSLRQHIGVVTQDSHMFHDSILNNLIYANPKATETQIEKVCRSAQIWDFIQTLPNKFDTVVGERGHRLSGGEKQRLAIARLLLKRPSIVILDEATAHLDSENESLVQEALKTALVGRTSIVIAHRLSTIVNADQILVIDQGEIAERGTHEELIKKGGNYFDLYQKQNIQRELI